MNCSPQALSCKEYACNAGDHGSIHGWGRYLEKEIATLSSVLAWGNPMDRGIWWAIAHGILRVRHDLLSKHQVLEWVKVLSCM